METVRSLNAFGERSGPVILAVGFFDGVHIGHAQLLSRAIREAHRCHGEAWAMTFDRHPLKVLNPAQAPPLLLQCVDEVPSLSTSREDAQC